MKFKDRVFAANILSAILHDKIGKELKKKENKEDNVVVLGIPRGGVILVDVVATKLNIKHFDVVIPRKLTSVGNKEQAIGAIMDDVTFYFDDNDPLISELPIHSEYLEKEKQHQLKEIERRKSLYRKDKSDLMYEMKNKTVILIDDGAALEATVAVDARWIKRVQKNWL